IHSAAGLGDLGVVESLLSQDPELLNAGDGQGLTPLHWAAATGQRRVADVLLERGVPMDIFAAAALGDLPALRALVKEDAGLINARNRMRSTPLHWAAETGRAEAAEFLLAQGADVNAPDEHGATPLHDAAWMGQKATVELLLANGADATARSDSHLTPLSMAMERGHRDVVGMLLRHAAAKPRPDR
ncbi:MAG: ankyrin repeat domain-containing protein, partial [Candidatus Brocadiae bacterium]|nr:ankyrin repeat domain-containing protein [Candidatus Brocadiia bacterium]